MKGLRTSLFLLALCGLVAIAPRVRAQEDKKPPQEKEQETVKLETTLVPVTFVVKDKKGNFIERLKKEDFQISEDGKEVEIAQFGVSPFALDVQEPLAVAILLSNFDACLSSVDTTEIVSTVVNSVDRQTPMGFFWTLTKLHTLQWFTIDKSLQRAAAAFRMDEVKVGGERYLYKGITEAVHRLSKAAETPGAPPRKKVLFVLSEGYSFDSPRGWVSRFNWFPSNYAKAWEAVQAANVIIYGVISDRCHELLGLYAEPFRAFEELVEGSGGKIITYNSKLNRFADVFAQLRHSYLLTYEIPEHQFDKRFHKIKVVCRRPGARVVGTREGYWAVRAGDLPAGREGASGGSHSKVESEAQSVFVYLPSGGESGEPLDATLEIAQHTLAASGQTAVDLSLTFDVHTLRPSVEIARQQSHGLRGYIMDAHFNYDLWFDIYEEGGSSAFQQWQRTVNVILKREELPEYQETGIQWREPLVLPAGRYRVRVVAMEPSTLRKVELTTSLAIGGAGADGNSSIRTTSSAGQPRDCSAVVRPSANAPVKAGAGEDLKAAGKKSLGMTLLIDANEMTTKDMMNQLAASVGRFVPALRTEDMLEVKIIGSRVKEALARTTDHVLSMEAIKKAEPALSDATRVNGFQAILCSATESAARGEIGPVFVWVTNLNDDFRDYFELIHNGEYLTGQAYQDYRLALAPYDKALKAVREKGIAVYVVELPNKLPKFRIWEEIRKNREKRLQKFAEATGGRLIKVSKIEEVGDALTQIAQEQRGVPRSPGSRQRQ